VSAGNKWPSSFRFLISRRRSFQPWRARARSAPDERVDRKIDDQDLNGTDRTAEKGQLGPSVLFFSVVHHASALRARI
jgi:hypothetical protein